MHPTNGQDEEAFHLTGYLIVTPTFVGIAEADGTVTAVFPVDNIRRVVALSADEAAAA